MENFVAYGTKLVKKKPVSYKCSWVEQSATITLHRYYINYKITCNYIWWFTSETGLSSIQDKLTLRALSLRRIRLIRRAYAFESLYGGQLTLWTQLIEPNYLGTIYYFQIWMKTMLKVLKSEIEFEFSLTF